MKISYKMEWLPVKSALNVSPKVKFCYLIEFKSQQIIYCPIFTSIFMTCFLIRSKLLFFRLFGKASKFGLWYGIPRNPTAVEMSVWSKSGAIIDNLLTSREQILCHWNLIKPSHRTKMRWKIWFVKFWWRESTVQALMQKCVLFDTMKSYQKRKRNFKHFSCLFYQKMTRFILWF